MASQTRPLSIAQQVYRLWATLRARQYSAQLSEVFLHEQGGGRGRHDAETLLLDFLMTDPHCGYAASLDFAKAFDSIDVTVVLHILRLSGLPVAIVDLLAAQWQQQQRWAVFGGAVHPTPMTHVRAIPQGDPWSMWAIACLLAPVLREAQMMHPQVRQYLYVDDRTLKAPDLPSLMAAIQHWNCLGDVIGLKSNASKQQNWPLSDQAAAVLAAAPVKYADAGTCPGCLALAITCTVLRS